MANHKRGRPKNRRAGCLLCKPWKANGVGRKVWGEFKSKPSDERRIQQAEYVEG